jgi:hypothetical protein
VVDKPSVIALQSLIYLIRCRVRRRLQYVKLRDAAGYEPYKLSNAYAMIKRLRVELVT